jgi:hypothetical protein
MGHYGKGELVFMDIENIHVVRSSFNKLVELCTPGEVIEGTPAVALLPDPLHA